MATPPSRSASPPAKRLKPTIEVEALPTATAIVAAAKPKLFRQPKSSTSSNKRFKKGKRGGRALPEAYSSADVLFRDVKEFLGEEYVDEVLARKDGSEWDFPESLKVWDEVEVRVGEFTVSGESISLYTDSETGQKWSIITPFAHPGDLIRCKINKHDRLHSMADMIKILEYSEEFRGGEGDRRKFPNQGCKYFGECGGCQLQPLPYELQLLHKRTTLAKAYARFSALRTSDVPEILPTIGSPKQWGYRTKITPHFNPPPKWAQRKQKEQSEEGMMNGATEEKVGEEDKTFECTIGFDRKGKPGVLDIEECPIATPVLNTRMTVERKKVQETIYSFSKMATILLRDSLPPPESLPFDPSTPELPAEAHICVTNHKEPVYERVGSFLFSFAAGSFFQNNNSILIPLLDYVKEAIFPSVTRAESASAPPSHLVDTYCGSGLFGITLSPYFEKVAGVEITMSSIIAAKKNAEINNLVDKTKWLCGKAEDIFGDLPGEGFEGDKSCVIIDPPRKGCDEPFLEQLLKFNPTTIVYVSCNVHTQARDVGYMVNESRKRTEGGKYVLESLRGFDLFPQTAHVEGVAVLRLVV
ncbi:tRNA (uracil-5-)-methyltransferase, partial [Tremellales sp. Uapishka_1]